MYIYIYIYMCIDILIYLFMCLAFDPPLKIARPPAPVASASCAPWLRRLRH